VTAADPIFEPFTINGVEFPNRLVRSSIGGRYAYYDGTVNPAWVHFERRFAENGVGAIVSATLTVDDHRWAPLEYPKISRDRFVAPIAEGVRAVQAAGARYILQIGDPGYHTQTGLFSEPQDALSSSAGFDLLYGYRNTRRAMTTEQIADVVEHFANAAVRVREAGCDGLEVTASKGYLIHQFLNPGINRRTDAYGGSAVKRFRLLEEIVTAIRDAIGRDFLFGIRISARDYNYLPLNVRWPLVSPLRDWWFGNDVDITLEYGRRLKALGVDYLHVSNGFGFINPRENPGAFPMDGIRIFFNSTRHLGWKAAGRAILLNGMPAVVRRATSVGWNAEPGSNLDDAATFRREVGLPVIANGGFQQRSLVEHALTSRSCDLVSMARPLLANPDLPQLFREGQELPDRPCTFCNLCAVRTTTGPLGCYEPRRFGSQDEMEQQILSWSSPNADES
jgi:2,4-dienoyl-CoA reductase-like NADH-dependent reductase (Old Yellow Enzyme family)